jgi:protein phosphatase
VALFFLALVVIFGGIIGFTIWFNRASYFVGIDNSHVAIFEGRPGGFLWFKPTIARETSLPISSLLGGNVALLRAGVLESSYDAAQHVVDDLTNEDTLLGIPSATSSTTVVTTPATTIPVTTTTTAIKTTTTIKAATTTTVKPKKKKRRRA